MPWLHWQMVCSVRQLLPLLPLICSMSIWVSCWTPIVKFSCARCISFVQYSSFRWVNPVYVSFQGQGGIRYNPVNERLYATSGVSLRKEIQEKPFPLQAGHERKGRSHILQQLSLIFRYTFHCLERIWYQVCSGKCKPMIWNANILF